MNNTCLKFGNLTLGYQGRAAVHRLNGGVKRDSLTAVVGVNGSGKSTLLKGIAGILKPISGACVPGFRRLAYLAQQSELDRTFPADTIRLSVCLDAVGLTGFETPRSVGCCSPITRLCRPVLPSF
jgi:zinc/manganese transport system ATP-binding protein